MVAWGMPLSQQSSGTPETWNDSVKWEGDQKWGLKPQGEPDHQGAWCSHEVGAAASHFYLQITWMIPEVSLLSLQAPTILSWKLSSTMAKGRCYESPQYQGI